MEILIGIVLAYSIIVLFPLMIWDLIKFVAVASFKILAFVLIASVVIHIFESIGKKSSTENNPE